MRSSCGFPRWLQLTDRRYSLTSAAARAGAQVAKERRPGKRITMKTLLSCSRTVLLAALASGLVAAIGPVAAQQQTKAPAVNPSPAPVPGLPAQAPGVSPPSWAQGRPDTPEVTNIAPVVPPPIPA